MEIVNSTLSDMDTIFRLYAEGTAYQKAVAKKYWKGFERSLVEQEIREQRQWKIVQDGEIACIFATAFQDPVIWQEKDREPSLYLHRIATNRRFSGQGMVGHIVTWARKYAAQHQRMYLRMDTGSGNDRLNNYYISCGFTYLGISERAASEGLPEHYKDGSSSLFEINLQKQDLSYLPPNLPVPEDDGACDHLPGRSLPAVTTS